VPRVQKVRKFSNIRRNPPRLITREQLGCGSSPRLILEIDVGQLLAFLVAYDEPGGLFFD
jgi:hypothetical protein